MTLHEIISQATRAGYRVAFCSEPGGWLLTTPKAPRRPSLELGLYRDERTAWMDAALLASSKPYLQKGARVGAEPP